MIQRFKTPFIKPVLCALVVSLLTGCASVSQESAQTSQPFSPPLQSLKISDRPAVSTPGSSSLPLIEVSVPPPVAHTVDLTGECDDLFQRMRNGFSMPDINTDLVLYHQQWYMNRPDYLRRMVERSSLYLHFVIEELDKRGMPMEIALLPMVESAYNPMAYSRSKASGLWQFIPSTGKHYKLEQDWWKDERRDIVASTSAALDYLQSIYEMHGDWHLALASYNWGEGAVGRAINKNQVRGLPTDYLSLTMPNETRNYVPKLQALKNIFSNKTLISQLGLNDIPNRPYFSTVTQSANIDINLAAKLAEMPIKEFVALNPAYNRPVITSDSPMVIPTEKYDTFMSNLEAHEASNKPLSSWQSYTVRPGDKLEKIAPRFGMSVASLRAANGIRGRLRIRPGLTLLVASKESENPTSIATPEQPRFPDADPEPANAARTHTIRRGESLLGIARHYGISVDELKRINHLNSNRISAGTRLAINTKRTSLSKHTDVQAKAITARGTKSTQSRKQTKIARYTIRRGDTLYSIARQFKVEINDLKRWNGVSANALQPGKTLTIQLAQNP